MIILNFRSNGKEVIVGCFQQIIKNPPEIGSVITVKHNGYYQTGTLQHPFYWRQRKDIQWEDTSRKMVYLH